MKTYITPNEAISLVQYTPKLVASNAVGVAAAIANIVRIQKEERTKNAHILAWALYNAGRIDGIRSERARRKRGQK